MRRHGDIAVVEGVARIPLKGGRLALIDAADLPLIEGWRLTAVLRQRRWYVTCQRPGGRMTYLHRLITGAAPRVDVDHENLDGLDNRRSNLRTATRSQNNANTEKVTRATTSRFKGVYRHSGGKLWVAQVKRDRRARTSYWPTEEAAARAYDAMAVEAFGDRARLNFPRVEASA